MDTSLFWRLECKHRLDWRLVLFLFRLDTNLDLVQSNCSVTVGWTSIMDTLALDRSYISQNTALVFHFFCWVARFGTTHFPRSRNHSTTVLHVLSIDSMVVSEFLHWSLHSALCCVFAMLCLNLQFQNPAPKKFPRSLFEKTGWIDAQQIGKNRPQRIAFKQFEKNVFNIFFLIIKVFIIRRQFSWF